MGEVLGGDLRKGNALKVHLPLLGELEQLVQRTFKRGGVDDVGSRSGVGHDARSTTHSLVLDVGYVTTPGKSCRCGQNAVPMAWRINQSRGGLTSTSVTRNQISANRMSTP